MYSKIGEIQVQESHVIEFDYREANITLTSSNRLIVQSGDVVGFYHPPDSRYQVRTIQTDGYMLYIYDGTNITTSLDSSSSLKLLNTNRRQPLIQFTLGE